VFRLKVSLRARLGLIEFSNTVSTIDKEIVTYILV